MSTLLEVEPTSATTVGVADQLRTTMGAVRIQFTWLGTRKTLTPAQKSQAAETFGAERTFLSAGKKLLDTSHPAFKQVTNIRTRIIAMWHGATLPFPEPGIRLIPQPDIATFIVQITSLKQELTEAVTELERHYDELKQAAARRLGSLYDRHDYPASLQGWFDVGYDFPSIEPPEYLRRLSPRLYQQEASRVAERFAEAVRLAETAFTEEFARLVTHLTERLSGSEDGSPKVFRDSAVENLREFFERFRHLNIGSHEQLETLVGDVQRLVRGIEPQTLRDNAPLRQRIAMQLSSVQATLDGWLVERPRRKIIRTPTA